MIYQYQKWHLQCEFDTGEKDQIDNAEEQCFLERKEQWEVSSSASRFSMTLCLIGFSFALEWTSLQVRWNESWTSTVYLVLGLLAEKEMSGKLTRKWWWLFCCGHLSSSNWPGIAVFQDTEFLWLNSDYSQIPVTSVSWRHSASLRKCSDLAGVDSDGQTQSWLYVIKWYKSVAFDESQKTSSLDVWIMLFNETSVSEFQLV